MLRGGAEIIVNVSASPYHAGKAQLRKRMLCTRAADNIAVVCYVNLVGGQDEIVYDGCSLIVDEQGHVLGEGRMFEEDLVVADVDLESVFSARLHDPRLRKGRALDAGESTARIELPPARSPEAGEARPGGGNGGVVTLTSARPALETRPAPRTLDLVEEVYEALVLGTRDYVVKNGFQTVVLGLSGGVDSALTACIAADAIGAGNVVGVSDAVAVHLRGLARGRRSARALARYAARDDPDRRDLPAVPARTSPRRSNAARPDSTEENLQARIRGNHADGALQQVRLARAHDRQQERDVGRLQHAVRRHRGRLRGDQGRVQDDGLPRSRAGGTSVAA